MLKRNGAIGLGLAALMMLSIGAVSGSATTTSSGGFSVKSQNIQNPTITATAGMEPTAAPSTPSGISCGPLVNFDLNDEVYAQSARNYDKFLQTHSTMDQDVRTAIYLTMEGQESASRDGFVIAINVDPETYQHLGPATRDTPADNLYLYYWEGQALPDGNRWVSGTQCFRVLGEHNA